MNQNELEQTLVLIKPDAMKNSLTGYVLSQLSEFHTGLRFAAAKIVHVSRMLAEEHYAEHLGKPFYEPLLEYIQGYAHYPDAPSKRRVIAFIYQGPDAVLKIRDISGPTNPHDAREKRPGSIRALGTIVPVKNASGNTIVERIDNLIHASANLSDAEREIKLWFKPNDIPPSMRIYATEVSDSHYYFRNNQLFTAYESGSTCLLAPGDTAWQSDLEALRLILKGQPTETTVTAIAAKYLINEQHVDR
jgi:nucleoside-diphosphate kinase